MTTITINNLYIFMLLYLSIMGVIIKVLMQRDKKIKLQKYEIDIKYGTDINVEKALDSIINNVFNEYRLYNLEYKDNEYIKEEDEKKIVSEVSELVTQRISPALLTQLSTYFNLESIGEVVANKIYAVVMDYRIKNNMSS